MFISLLAVSVLVCYLAVAVLLFGKYRRTRDVGFIWLGVAVVVWPVVSRLLLDPLKRVAIDRLIHGHAIGLYPFTLVERGRITIGEFVASVNWTQQFVGICLLLVAVLYLSKTKSKHSHEPA
jgi:hypothetical protein